MRLPLSVGEREAVTDVSEMSQPGSDASRPAPSSSGMALVHLGNSAVYRVLQPFLLSCLVAAFLAGPIAVMRQLDASPRWNWLGWFVFLVALQASSTTLWLYHPDRRQVPRSQYRLAELVVVLVAARLVTWAVAGRLPGLAEWRGYVLNPWLFFDGAFLGYVVLGIGAWERAMSLSYLFSQLAMGIDEAAYYQLPARDRFSDNFNPFQGDRSILVRSFFQQWLGMGMVLGICAAMTTFRLEELATSFRNLTRLGLPSELLFALVAYFLIGLWLLSLARLSALYARWVIAGIRADDTLLRRWQRASLVLVLGVGLVASLLPIGSTFTLSRILQAAIQFIASVASLLFVLIISLFTRLFSGLTGSEETTQELLRQQREFNVPEVAPVGPQGEGAAMILGGAFWAVVIVIALAAVVFVLRERGAHVDMSALRGFWKRLRVWWAMLLLSLREQVEDLQVLVRTRRGGASDGSRRPPSPFRFVRVSGLSPRDQIRFFYLAAVRRAGEEGVPRGMAETPVEFAEDLKVHWPEAEDEVNTLTEAFLEARYSRHKLESDAVGPVKQTWQRMRSQIRHRRERASERPATDDEGPSKKGATPDS